MTEAAKRAAGVLAGKPPMRRYTTVYTSALVGLVAAVLALVFIRSLWTEFGSIGFFGTYLVSIVARLHRLNAAHLRIHADESDTPGYIIIVVALCTLIAASASLIVLLNSGHHPDPVRMTFGIAALVAGWLGMHAMLAFHYAYEYYGTDEGSPVGPDGHRPKVGGLDFPGKEAPDALSFLYFSFVIAMTAQVSDVTVTSNSMRRLVLLHGILAFFFNTVILAIAVNVVVSLAN